MKKSLLLIALLGALFLPTGCSTTPRGFPPRMGILNFDVVDSKLTRGAQPNHAALDALAPACETPGKPLTIVNLRMPSDTWVDEAVVCKQDGIIYRQVPLNGLLAPSQAQIETVLALIDNAPGVVFVHCQHGCDRTGTVVACYRIRHKEMSNADALNDAVAHGISPLECGMKGFIKRFK
jgi:protein tyrosine/serine phosphatase